MVCMLLQLTLSSLSALISSAEEVLPVSVVFVDALQTDGAWRAADLQRARLFRCLLLGLKKLEHLLAY